MKCRLNLFMGRGRLNKLLKCLIVSMVMLVSLSCVEPTGVEAAGNIHAVNPDTFTIKSEYGFKFKYIPGVTTYEYAQNVGGELNDTGSYVRFPAPSSNDTFNSTYGDGKAWVRLNNVGAFEGNIVDVKISLLGADAVSANKWFSFGMGVTGEYMANIDLCNIVNPRFKYEMFYHGTNTLIPNLKGSATFSDVDDGQGVEILSGGSEMYYEATDWLNLVGNAVMSTPGRDSVGHERFAKVTVGYSNPLQIKYHTKEYAGAWFGFSPTAVAGFETPTIQKFISTGNVHNSDQFYYDMTYSLPSGDADFNYTKLEVVDNLPNIFNVAGIYVYNEKGTDVSAYFSSSSTDLGNRYKRLVVSMANPFTAQDLYGHDYRVRVFVNKTKGGDVSGWKNVIPNTAWLDSNKGTKTSNSVNVSFNHNLTSQVSNGTITQGVTGLGATNNKTFSYSPTNATDYVLDSVVVDGVSQNVESYPSSYTFSNVNDDHSISVAYRRVFKIETSSNNASWGSVTSSIYKIESGSTKTISYSPSNGYYVKSVSVDGSNIDLNSYPTSYSFSNITSDHKVSVVFAKKPVIQITSKIGNMGDVVLDKGNPISLVKIEGTDYLGRRQSYFRIIWFGDKTLSSKTINVQIPAGVYTISQIAGNEYSQKSVEALSNSSIDGSKVIVDTRNVDSSSVRFTNNQTDYSEFSHNGVVINNLK